MCERVWPLLAVPQLWRRRCCGTENGRHTLRRESHIFRVCLVPGHGWPCHGMAVASRNPAILATVSPQLIRATRRTSRANDKEKSMWRPMLRWELNDNLNECGRQTWGVACCGRKPNTPLNYRFPWLLSLNHQPNTNVDIARHNRGVACCGMEPKCLFTNLFFIRECIVIV
jgi:hypothetical protein